MAPSGDFSADGVFERVQADAELEADRAFARAVELHRAGRSEGALSAYAEALRINGLHLEALRNMAILLGAAGRFEAAYAAFERAVALDPESAALRFHYGRLLRESGRYREALEQLTQALRLGSRSAELHAVLALIHRDLGQFDKALEIMERAHGLDPDLRGLPLEWGFSHLHAENYEAGFAAIWEWQRETARQGAFAKTPLWRGEPLRGRTLLLQAEQNDADNILYLRYLPYAARLAKEGAGDGAQGGSIVLESLNGMTQLFSAMPGADIHVTRGSPGPPPDLRMPLVCLPGLFQTTRESVPGTIPYIALPPAGQEGGELQVPGGSRLKVGLIWDSSGISRTRALTSLSLPELLPLTGSADVAFYSLQKGEAAADLLRVAAGGLVQDVSGEIEDYLDYARVLSQLDLLISVDCGAAQLACALGRPVWLLADYACDWRWRRSGQTTPWYPSARIFRQQRPGDWSLAVREVHKALVEVMASG